VSESPCPQSELLLRIRLGSKKQGVDPERAVEAFRGPTGSATLEEVADTIAILLPDVRGAEFWSLMSAIFYLGGGDEGEGRVARGDAVELVREIFKADLHKEGSSESDAEGAASPDRELTRGAGGSPRSSSGSESQPLSASPPAHRGGSELAEVSSKNGLDGEGLRARGVSDAGGTGDASAKSNEFSTLEGAPIYDLSRIGDFLRASALRQASCAPGRGSADASREQEEVLAHIDDLTTLAGHHVRVEEFVGGLGKVVKNLEDSGSAVQAGITAAFGQVRSHLDSLEADLRAGAQLGLENSLSALRNQHEKYRKIRADILQAIKMAEATLLDRDAASFVELSRSFKEFSAELLRILVLDLEPCARTDFSDVVDPNEIIAALDKVVVTQHLSAPSVAPSEAGGPDTEVGEAREAEAARDAAQAKLAEAQDQAARLQVEVALRGERIDAAVRESQNLRVERTELEAQIRIQATQHAEELAKLREQVVEQVRGEFAEQQAQFERRLESALAQSETALLRESSGGNGRPKSASARAPRTKPAARPLSASVLPTPTPGAGAHMPLWQPDQPERAVERTEAGVEPRSALPPGPKVGRRAPQGLAFGATSRRFGSDGALGRLSMQGQRLMGRAPDT